jgi:phage tail-like protein
VGTPELLGLQHCYEVKLGSAGTLLGVFLEVSGLKLSYETFPYAEGGRNDFTYQHRGRLQQSNLTLKSGLTSATALLDWVLEQPPLGKPQDLQVIFKSADGSVLRSFGFAAAVPVSWTGPNANIGANTVATESLEIAHRGMTSGMGSRG